MKWFFAILVILNLIVFGNVVTSRIWHMDTVHTQPIVQILPVTTDKVVKSDANSSSQPQASSSVESKSHLDNGEKKTVASKKNKVILSTQKEKQESKQKTSGSSLEQKTTLACSATLIIPEDDFHRIKGLFRWPYAATSVLNNQNPISFRYMVAIKPSSGLENNLKRAGFDVVKAKDMLSIGVFNNRSDAESQLANAKINGFNQAKIIVLNDKGNRVRENDILNNVPRVRVSFLNIDTGSAEEIRRIGAKYGVFKYQPCRE